MLRDPTSPAHGTEPPLVVVCGVSGSGKSTVGTALAEALGVPFGDADDLHSPAAIATMHAGRPLGEADRAPWLARVGAWLAARTSTGGVMACSALRRAHRDVLRAAAPRVWFVQLTTTQEEVEQRVEERGDHFMPAVLLPSQYDALEPLAADEPGVRLDATEQVEGVVAAAVAAVVRRG